MTNELRESVGNTLATIMAKLKVGMDAGPQIGDYVPPPVELTTSEATLLYRLLVEYHK